MAESPQSATTPVSDTPSSSGDEAGHVLSAFVRRVVGPVLPRWPTVIRVLVVAFVVAAICWYFGADVGDSILLGSVLTTVGLVGSTRRSVLDRGDTNWRGGAVRNREGARKDVDELSWSLRTHYGRVGNSALRRVERLAGLRLATFGLDVRDPADRRAIEHLIGRRAYVVLAPNARRSPYLRSLLHCLDALDSLNASRPTEPGWGPRRWYSILTSDLQRRARAR